MQQSAMELPRDEESFLSDEDDEDGDVGDSSSVSTDFPERQGVYVFDIFSVDGGTTKYISKILEYTSAA